MKDLARYIRHGTVTTSTGSDEWKTPKKLFDELNKRFSFTRDAAASKHNSHCDRYWDERDDALQMDWKAEKSIFCNPPYSKVSDFLALAHLPGEAVFLIPMRPQTSFFLKHVWSSPYLHEMMILHRGVRFLHPEGKPASRSPMSCCVLVYKNQIRESDLYITVNCADSLALLHVVAGNKPGRKMSIDFSTKDKVIQDYQNGSKVSVLVTKYGVSKSTIYRWIV